MNRIANEERGKESQQVSSSHEQDDDDADLANMFNLKSVKKKKKSVKKATNSISTSPQPGSPSGNPEATAAQQPALPYSYRDLLDRAMLQVTASNPSHGHHRRFTLQPPKLARWWSGERCMVLHVSAKLIHIDFFGNLASLGGW
eukprot:CAMPEP_0114481956 /NCGR_PEP_ID=MMETSP0104-20121206/17978_1 /TAXON_ID=37642 ORGANISM="Paraphysomonas imperforata, Strain PA2" /NCGR_SAMPLE_ID=MMETSP0104 /ASSEMBLY_ACC=CAM_ASM_000202 /LENGTH=143 /DNA_ID=CAMNT_0001657615 /DNA_START=71 /DNA_END=499 /DNA_ORIENTATION=-